MHRVPVTCAFIAVAACAVAPVRAQAQTIPTQVTFNVPFTLEKLHPDIVAIQAECTVRQLTQMSGQPVSIGSALSPLIPLSQLTADASGRRSGTATVAVTANRHATAENTTYNCSFRVCAAPPAVITAGTACGLPHQNATDPRLLVTTATEVSGAVQW